MKPITISNKVSKTTNILLVLASLLWLSSCAVFESGKFDGSAGVPSFIEIGITTREQLFEQLGEPLVHRYTLGVETAIYHYHQRATLFINFPPSTNTDLVVRFKDGIVIETQIETPSYR